MLRQIISKLANSLRRTAQGCRDHVLVKIDSSTKGEFVAARPIQAVTYALILFSLSLIAWVFLTDVDRVVSAQGMIITSQPKYVLRPLNKSIIREINVKVGQVVKRGDVLVVLDPTSSDADVKKLSEKFEAYQAKVAKLESHTGSQEFSYEGKSFSDWKLQNSSFNAEKLQYESKIKEYDEKISRLQSYLKDLAEKELLLNEQIAVAEDVFKMWDELVNKHDFGSKTNYYKAKTDLLSLRTQLSDNKAESGKSAHERNSMLSEKKSYEKEWESKRLEDLISAMKDMRETEQELIKAQTENRMVMLSAHEDAVVLELSDISSGSVVTPSDSLIKMIPLNSPLSVEVRIGATDIAHVAAGQEVIIKLDSLPFQRFGQLTGKVSTISRDSFSSDESSQSPQSGASNSSKKSTTREPAHYLARIDIVQSQIKGAPESFRLLPGMSCSVDIKVGKRPISEFILFPLQRAFKESLREP